jgi:ABC-type Co2+ transport system permease subunit
MSGFDLGEFIKRIIKYLIEGLVIALISFVIPKKSLNIEEITIIALTAAATFSLLDVFLPSVAASAKQGVGFSIGTGLTGGLHILG